MTHTFFKLTLVALVLAVCSKQKEIRLPLTYQDGFGSIEYGMGSARTYPKEEENHPFSKTFLTMKGVPEDWTDLQFGDIDTDLHQTIYQSYITGKLDSEMFNNITQAWNWELDSTAFPNRAIKSLIGFVIGKDASGTTKILVDRNNNLDLSDDEAFTPLIQEKPVPLRNMDSLLLSKMIDVKFERYVNQKVEEVSKKLALVYWAPVGMLMVNFPGYATAELDGTELLVCSDGFKNTIYRNVAIGHLPKAPRQGEKLRYSELSKENQYIEIKGKLYLNKGVDIGTNELVLEAVEQSKNEIAACQEGFKAFPIKAKEFATGVQIDLAQYRGKYLLLDFWATWCGPCLREMPNLKELYGKTDRDKFEIIGIVGNSKANELEKLLAEQQLGWPQILSDQDNKIIETYDIKAYPTTLLLDPNGVIVAKNLRGKSLEDKVLELLAQAE